MKRGSNILDRTETYNELNIISERIIGVAIEVHKNMGPGLLESVYEECMSYELGLRDIKFERQKLMPVIYKDKMIESGFRTDLVVEGKVIVELKSVETILSVHEAQILNYLKLSNLQLGLLINFNVQVLKNGITRIINGSKS